METIIVLLYTLAILSAISTIVLIHTLARSIDILDELKEISNILKRMENK
jgi:hypothetical protein|nr:MAG TPA: hypothetical protein [Caudoviricetes sp.]